MKRLLTLLILILVGTLLYLNSSTKNLLNSFVEFSFCEKPIYYSIGTIDKEFGITKSEVEQNTKIAAALWNDALDKDLFVYSPDAELKVNLVYDGRQTSLSTIKI